MKAFIVGNAICIVKDDFINLQESKAVFVNPATSRLSDTVEELNKLFAADERQDRSCSNCKNNGTGSCDDCGGAYNGHWEKL